MRRALIWLALLPCLALAGEATISWTHPTRRVDGTAYTNPGGYRIWERCGGAQPSLLTTVQYPQDSYDRSGAPDGTTCYWSLSAFDLDGIESARTNEVSKAFPPLAVAAPSPAIITGLTWAPSQGQGPPSMAAPSFIQEAETSWTTTTAASKTTASFNVVAGDILVAFGIGEDNGATGAVIPSGGSLSWTNRQTVTVALYTTATMYTAVVDADKAMTVTFTRAVTSGDRAFGGNVLTFRSSDGVGASSSTNVSSGAPTLNITTTQANSAIVVANGDWNATDGASRTWRTNAGALTEQTYFRNTTNYATYGGYHANAGAVGTYAVGLSAPSGQKYSIAAVEIKGTAGGAVASLPPVTPFSRVFPALLHH